MRSLPNKNQIILEGYRGSISHSVYVKDYIDDKDIFGIFIPPKKYIIGLEVWDMYEKIENEYDILYYNIKKYFYLAMKGNPNTLTLLWLNPEFYLKTSKYGQMLIDNRNLFVSKQCYKSFIGYAYGQMKRMEQFKFYGYMGEKRKKLVEKYGYDVKNAAHLIRILKMGIEFISTGELNVFRPDRRMLLSIKMGEWKLEKVKEEANKLFSLAYEIYVKSTLPETVDKEKCNELLIEILENYWKNK